MSYKVLARKWRPQTFQDVIGQEHITQTLTNAIKTDRLAHAYLFGGPRGIGKTSIARILAKAINCKEGEPGIPCNKCISCTEITDGSSVDVQEIDGASNRGIDEIRALRENVKYMPSSSSYRVYIIDEVHMLTMPAFNALLKTLEEPPAHVKFIFATTETHKVPVTILSRCQRFDFKKIPQAILINHLETIAAAENIQVSKSGLALIARESEGCMRDAQSLLDQVISFAGEKAEDRDITEILGVIDSDIIFEASRAIIEGSSVTCLEIVDRIYNYGYDIKKFYSTLMSQFRNLLVSVLASQNNLLDMSDSDQKRARSQAEQAGSEKLQILLNFLINREQDLRFTSNARLLLETTMIKLCNLGDFLSFDDLMKRIDGLEKSLLATASSCNQPTADHISDPAAEWASENPKKVEIKTEEVKAELEEVDATHEKEELINLGWDDFLSFLETKSRPMFNVLKDWEFRDLTTKTLEIAKSNQSFSSSFFDDKDRYVQLSSYCRDFFKRELRINIVPGNRQVSKKNPTSNEKQHQASGTEKHSDLPQPVQDILHTFQGEIIKE
ncbi:MAG: DNA polymerase III subunit gamma/tau [Deltaproteobacteria bacterium]|nr:DNA polymerase III subunit gamma/tau [Deltaproteobacteria bacterium]